MSIAGIESRTASPPYARLQAVPLWAWWLVALIATTGLAVLVKGTGRTFEFIDSDDALRFLHVRELLAGAPWFEITTNALGGDAGLLSHWSRLIDAPLAFLLVLFRLFLPEAAAQKAVVTLWPMLMLGAVTWMIARAVSQVHGRATALCALALCALSLLTYYQFAPGRIDHHNVMIATTVSAALMIWAWPQSIKAWRWSGVLCGVALAVGYEALAPVFAIATLTAGWALLDRRLAEQASAFVIGLAATLAIVLVATVAPSRWLTIYCDALSLNVVAMAGLAGAGFVYAMRRGADWSMPRLIGTLGASGAAGIAVFGWLEPACLAGPMGQVPAELTEVWMGHVDEAKSLLAELMRGQVDGAIGPVGALAVGLAAATAAIFRSDRAADRFLLLATSAFVVLAYWQMKFLAYASLLLVPGMAIFIMRLPACGEIRAPLVRGFAMLGLNQLVLFSLILALKSTVAPAAPTSATASVGSPQQACTRADELAALASVPAGLVVTHNDIGAHLAVVTGHRALAGPYHRIPGAIIANHEILSAAPPASAGKVILRERVDYVLTCAHMDAAQLERPGWQGSLLDALSADRAPGFLVPIALAQPSRYRMWRVDRSRLTSH